MVRTFVFTMTVHMNLIDKEKGTVHHDVLSNPSLQRIHFAYKECIASTVGLSSRLVILVQCPLEHSQGYELPRTHFL